MKHMLAYFTLLTIKNSEEMQDISSIVWNIENDL